MLLSSSIPCIKLYMFADHISVNPINACVFLYIVLILCLVCVYRVSYIVAGFIFILHNCFVICNSVYYSILTHSLLCNSSSMYLGCIGCTLCQPPISIWYLSINFVLEVLALVLITYLMLKYRTVSCTNPLKCVICTTDMTECLLYCFLFC